MAGIFRGLNVLRIYPARSDHARTSVQKELVQRYFENFAIPFSANVMSRLLAGHAVDFIAAARSLLPVERKKK